MSVLLFNRVDRGEEQAGCPRTEHPKGLRARFFQCTDLHERSELAASNTGCEAEMDEDETYDDETPIEETPGYLGHIFDGFISFSGGLKALDGFDFSLYGIMADELGQLVRQIEVQFA